MTTIKYSLLLLVLYTLPATGQDTLQTLTAPQLTAIVKQYHPVARQADILIEKTKAAVTVAKGGFDPYFKTESAQKTFDGNKYYYYNRPEITVPTWFGVEIAGGLEYLSGNRTDPSDTKGESSYLGISVPLAKNLLMDKRRAALQSARIYRDASAVEKRNILNNLLLEAMRSYWNWVQQYQVYTILADAVKVNEKRFALVKTSFRLGDRPAIDTTEALAQLLNFELLKSQAWLDFQLAGLELSVYLWTDDMNPYNLPPAVIPDLRSLSGVTADDPVPDLDSLLATAGKNHPELLLYDYKLDVLSVEKKLKFQELLPAINFRYNQLGKGYDIMKTASGPLFENNFQYGLSMSIPLRLSQGRGEYRQTKLKISETQLGQSQKKWQVETKIRSYYNELQALKSQVALQERAYQNYLALQRGEEIRFQAGESSLFLVNTRENKTLEALQKLKELTVKYYKTQLSLQWAAGLLIP